MKGEGTPFPCGKKLFPPPRPLLPPKPLIRTACITGSLFLWLAQVEGCSCSGKNSAPSAAGRGKDALKRLGGSIKYHRVLSGQARKFANTIPLDVDGDTATLQYFRFEPLHSQGNPIPIHVQVRWQNAVPGAKVFGRKGRGGRTFFQKGFPPRKLFSLQISRRLPAVPKTKNPRRSGDKKRPPRAVSCKGVSNNLWQRPTFPHDVMQYHRRWRA